MAAATKDRITEKKTVDLQSYPVKAATKIYAGTLVGLLAGYLVPAADTAALRVKGVATDTVDNTAGADGDLRCKVEAPIRARFAAASITQAMVGTKMHVVDDQTFDDATGTNSVVAGILDEFISTTEGWLYIDPATSLSI